MRKIKHILFLALVVGALLLTNSGCASLPTANAQELTDVGNLRREVQLLNLLNGLELRASQMRFIIEKAQEAEEIRDELMNRADENIEETVAVLSELRATLMRGENITDSSRERWFSIHSENQELREKYQAEMTRIAREVKVILEGDIKSTPWSTSSPVSSRPRVEHASDRRRTPPPLKRFWRA